MELHRAIGAVAGFAIALLPACGDAVRPAEHVVRDSLGIRIVEVDRDRGEEVFAVHPEPEWIVGGGSGGPGDLALHQVVDARLVGGGELVVAEGSTQQLIRVDLASGETRRWGGAGDGPEEFRGLARVFDAGDGRLGAYDRTRRRYVVLDEDGALVRDVSLPVISDVPDAPTLEIAGDGDGEPALHLALLTSFPRDRTEGMYRGHGPLARLSGSGQVDTLTLIPGLTTFAAGGFAGPVFFGATTLVAGSPAGIWVGDTAEQEVALWRSAEAPERIVRWTTAEPRVLTEERTEELWSRFEEGVPEGEREMVERIRAVAPLPETMPAFGSLIVRSTDELWIGSSLPPEAQVLEEPPPAQEWLVIDREGEGFGRARTPEGLRVLQVGDDFVLGVHTDELGVETLRRYRLERLR